MMLKLLFNIGLIFIATTTIRDANASPCNTLSQHVGDYIIPTHYDILIQPQLTTTDFDGHISIIIDIKAEINYINFHAEELIINPNTIFLWKDREYVEEKLQDHFYCKDTQIFVLLFHDKLAVGKYFLSMNFTGSLRGLDGFIGVDQEMSKCQNHDTQTYVTLLRYAKARRAFPCWDDVRKEANFSISVVHPARQTALSTVPVLYTQFMAMNTTDDTAKPMILTVFEVTPKILTHQVMIAIIEVQLCDDYDILIKGTRVQVWGRRNKQEQLTVVKDVVQEIMNFLTNKLGFSLRRLKTNFVLYPKLPVEGAGFWGLTVVREEDIISEEHSLGFQVKAEIIIAREIIQQYFDTFTRAHKMPIPYFYKGLSIFWSYHVVQECFGRLDLFVPRILQPAMHDNIAQDMIDLYNETDSRFIHFTYKKASALMRMFYYMLNKDLQKSIGNYLEKYKNVLDLYTIWNVILEKVTLYGKETTEKTVMDSWLQLRCYPLLFVKRNYTNNSISVEQRPSLVRDNYFANDSKWLIPITYTGQDELRFQNTSPRIISNTNFYIYGFDSAKWIIFNIQQTGYYRVNYDEDNWLKIAEYLNTEDYAKIHYLNRAQLIDDAYYFTMQGEIKCTTFMRLITYLEQETNFVPWYSMMNVLHYMSPFFQFPESQEFKEHMLNIVTNFLNTLNSSNQVLILEQTWEEPIMIILNWACKHGHTKCKQDANTELKTYLHNKIQPPSLQLRRDLVYCSGMMIADNETWMEVAKYFLYRGDMEMLEYLTCTESINSISKFLDFITIQEYDDRDIWKILTDEERIKLFRAIMKKHAGNQSVRLFLITEFKKIFPSQISHIEKLGHFIMNVYSKAQLNQFENDQIWHDWKASLISEETLLEMQRLITLRITQLDRQRNMFTQHFTTGNVPEEY